MGNIWYNKYAKLVEYFKCVAPRGIYTLLGAYTRVVEFDKNANSNYASV